MENSRKARERADDQFGTLTNRAEKGSALTLIKAEIDATHEKTRRLKALRMAREAEEIPAPVKTKAPARKKRLAS